MRITIPNDMGAVGKANRALEEYLEKLEAPPDTVFSATLALEEVVTNVIKYSYDDDASHEIVIEASADPEEITLRVTDDGHEFDPLAAPPPDLDTPLEERSAGGVGIHLVRNLARRLDYERSGGNNILTVCFSREPPAG